MIFFCLGVVFIIIFFFGFEFKFRIQMLKFFEIYELIFNLKREGKWFLSMDGIVL